MSLAFCLASGFFAVVAYYTGEWSENIAAAIPEIADSQLVAHHEFAKRATWIGVLLVIVSFISLVARNTFLKCPNQLLIINVLVAFAMLATVGYTAHLGGS